MNERELQRLYAQVVELAKNIPLTDRLEHPDASVTMVSPLCGSQVSVDLAMQDRTVSAFGQKVRACTLGAAAASILGRHVIGKDADELLALRDTMWRMLKEDGAPPAGEWAELAVLEPARDLISRHGSIMLVFDGVAEAICEIQGRTEAHEAKRGKGIPDTVRA